MKRILLCLTLCLLWGCLNHDVDPNSCRDYQDIAKVDIVKYVNSNIDSVVMKANDSVIGCDPAIVSDDYGVVIGYRKVIGSKTHRISFPINVRIQFFSQGDLLKELSFEMDKNTVVKIYKGSDCPKDIDSSLDGYCWFTEKLEDPHNNSWRCIEYYGSEHSEPERLCTIYTRPEYGE